jgi:hypothetical protein
MKYVWTWGGTYFGYVDDEDLWTHDGRHVGKVNGDEIYGPNGKYLGEVMNDNRLIVNLGKKSWTSHGFAPYGRRVGLVPYVNYVGYVMYVGHEDFPPPNAL